MTELINQLSFLLLLVASPSPESGNACHLFHPNVYLNDPKFSDR